MNRICEKMILLFSLFKTRKVCSKKNISFSLCQSQTWLLIEQRLSSMESIYCSVVSLSKIFSMIFNTKEECFHFASIYVYIIFFLLLTQ